MSDSDTKICPECAEEVKAAAKVCKHCGSRFEVAINQTNDTVDANDAEATTSRQRTKFAITLSVILAGAATLIYYLDRPSTPDEPAIVAEGKAYIIRDFRDPGAAEFKNISATGTCLQGEVNGKNGFGAFSGFMAFYYDGKTGVGQIAPPEPEFKGYVQQQADGDEPDLEATAKHLAWSNKNAECVMHGTS